MTNTEELEKLIIKSGLKKSFIAGKMGLSRYTFNKKCNNVNDFKAGEITKLCKILHITSLEEKDRIFFLDNE